MVCCGLSGKSVQSLVGLVAVLCLTVTVGGVAAATGLGWAALGPRGRFWARTGGRLWLTAVGRLGQDILANLRLIGLRWRCRLSARLFRLSPRMSGFVYRHFGLLAGSVFLVVAATVVYLAIH